MESHHSDELCSLLAALPLLYFLCQIWTCSNSAQLKVIIQIQIKKCLVLTVPAGHGIATKRSPDLPNFLFSMQMAPFGVCHNSLYEMF